MEVTIFDSGHHRCSCSTKATVYQIGNLSTLSPLIVAGVAAITVAGGIILFKEPITPKIAIGIFLAIVAIYLLLDNHKMI